MYSNISEQAGKTREFDHKFYLKIKDMIDNDDQEKLTQEKVIGIFNFHQIAIKLLRLHDYTQDGFVLTDFPENVKQAEILEEYQGGINSFIHLSLPDEILVEIEENTFKCDDCDHIYLSEDVID